MKGSVAVRDLRDLPFFQVRLEAIDAIRDAAPGRARARAIGFYAICCQLANEQRHAGEQRHFVSCYDELAARARIARKTVRSMLATLDQAGALRLELTPDLERGAVITTLHLPIQDGPFAAITVAMAKHLAANHGRVVVTTSRGDLGGYLTRDLGIIATLLEFCVRQYGENGGGSALLQRADLARRAGLSIDSVDNCVKVLETLGVLTVERRRGTNGGRFRPSIYSLVEPRQVDAEDQAGRAEPGNWQGGASLEPTPRVETRKVESGNRYGGGSDQPRRSRETRKADDGASQSGVSVLPEHTAQPSIARMGTGLELQPIEDSRSPFAATPQEGGRATSEEGGAEVCRALVRVLAETRGPGPGRRYDADRQSWHDAARRVLADHPLAKVLEAIAYLPFDQVVGTKVRSMPDLERHIEDLRHRANAARLQPAAGRPNQPGGGMLAWPEAKAMLMRAIQRHGAGAKQAALVELEGRDPQLRRFAEQVGWGALCQSPFEKQDYQYRLSWDELTRHTATEEAAA